jgi:aminoglycoside phosphotransferase (APT) family kinase protein
VVAALPWIRSSLLARQMTVIHGDVHPGNVIVQEEHGTRRTVMIDWGRSRSALLSKISRRG